MSNIIEKILSAQNINKCRVFVSATTGNGACYKIGDVPSEIVIRYGNGDILSSMTSINKILFDEGYCFLSCYDKEFTFIKQR